MQKWRKLKISRAKSSKLFNCVPSTIVLKRMKNDIKYEVGAAFLLKLNLFFILKAFFEFNAAFLY